MKALHMDDEETFNKYAWVILVILFIAQLFMAMVAYIWGPLGPYFIADLHMSSTQIGSLASAFFLGSVLMGIPAGILVDKKVVKLMLLASLLILGIGIMLIGQSNNYYMTIILSFFSGIGYGMINPISTKSLIAWFPSKIRGTAMGIRQSSVTMGGALGALIIPIISLKYGWKFAVLSLGVIIILLALLSIIFFQEPGRVKSGQNSSNIPADKNKLQIIKENLTHKETLTLLVISPFISGGQLCFTTFFIIYLQSMVFSSELNVGIFLTIAMVAGTVARIGWGMVSDFLLNGNRMYTLKLIIITGILGAFINLLLPRLSTPFSLLFTIIVAILLGSSLLGWQALSLTYLSELTGADYAGLITGVQVTVSWTGFLIMPVFFGFVNDTFGYPWDWLLIPIFMLLALMIFIFGSSPDLSVNKENEVGG